jgi:vanillate O-demethylase monooxygenase subunit
MGDRIQPQDIAAIEAIEAMLQSLPAPPKEVSCRADTGALKVRHRLARQIAAEQEERLS